MRPVKASILARPEFKPDPYPFNARMREEALGFRVSIPVPRRVWLLTRYHSFEESGSSTVARDTASLVAGGST